MKITQYFTDATHSLAKREVFPSVFMNNAITLTVGDEISRDFMGYGVAITGSSCYQLSTMSPEERRRTIEYIYGKNGVGLSVGRLTIGSSDYSAELYSYDDVEDDTALKHFSIERDKAYIIPMIKEILEVNPDMYIYAAPWSPPGWMKTSGNMCGGYMRDKYIDCYAEYLIRFVEEYEKCGIHISALTPQNEPETQQHNSMPACVWHPETEVKFISVLRKKLNERGLDTEIFLYDYNFNNWQRPMWCLDTFEDLKNECNAVSFHYYGGAIEHTAALRKAYPNLKLHFTEGGPRLFDHYDTDWCKWGIMLAKTLNCGFSSFTGWNLMLDEKGGPNIGPHFCGGLVTKNSITGELSYSGQLKALRHFAPFMKKNSRVLSVESSENCENMFKYSVPSFPMHATVFDNPDGTRVYVLVNPDNGKKQVQFIEGGSYHYAELLPDSVSTIVVER